MALNKVWLWKLCRVWVENGEIVEEVVDQNIFCNYDLILELSSTTRSVVDWVKESINGIEPEYFLPEFFEVCEEPVLYEVIGKFSIQGNIDYWGEYDEDYDFEIVKWSCDFKEALEL